MTGKEYSVLITGAGSGIGRGLSLYLAQRGFEIIVTDMDGGSAEETVSLIRERRESSGTRAYALDVTDEAAVQRVVEESRRVDVLINNAGLQHVAPLEDFPQDRWNLLIDVMLKGACQMTRAVLPRMKARGFGRIVNIGSIHSLVASPFKTAYVAAKHALLGFAKCVALETASDGITINTICPSYVRTPLVDAQIEQQAAARGIPIEEVIRKVMLDPMPTKSFISIEEIGAAIEFLIADTAGNITGQAIVIDGGWTIR